MALVYVYSGAAGAGTGADWTNAYTTLAAALTAKAAGDTFYVAHDHAETKASAMTMTPPGTAASPNAIVCVDRAGSVPPVSADLRTTATVSTTGASAITFAGGYAYWYGIAFSNATGSAAMTVLSATGSYVFESCELLQGGTQASAVFQIGTGNGGIGLRAEFINTPFGFLSVNQYITVRCCRVIWRDSVGLKTGGSYVVPTNLFNVSNRTGTIRIEGVDLSAMGSGKTIVAANPDPCEFWIKDCKLNSAVTVAATPTTPGGAETYLTRSDSSAANYRAEKYSYAGTETTETTLIRTGGASNGTTGFSAKIVTTANAKWQQPFEALPLAAWNGTVGSSVTVTIEGMWNAASLPNNDELWFDVEGLATTGSPLGDFATGTKADILATGAALTASTQAWDSLATSRANSTAYVLGDVIKLASNAGRIFFCTTAGTSAGSEPGGYASAVDGGSVTDGTAVFRAAVRFKKAVSITPQIAGAIYAYPKAGKASSTFYLDRKMTLS